MAQSKRLCRLHTRRQHGARQHGNYHSLAAYHKAQRLLRLQKRGRKAARRRA